MFEFMIIQIKPETRYFDLYPGVYVGNLITLFMTTFFSLNARTLNKNCFFFLLHRR